MVNVFKLKGKITEHGYNLQTFAKELGMTPQTLTSKLNGDGFFNTKQIERITTVLQIPNREIPAYFFISDVPKTETVGA